MNVDIKPETRALRKKLERLRASAKSDFENAKIDAAYYKLAEFVNQISYIQSVK